jgi:hypothetical protein
MAGEIIQLKEEAISHREEQIAHFDAALRVLDPSYRSDTLPPKKLLFSACDPTAQKIPRAEFFLGFKP